MPRLRRALVAGCFTLAVGLVLLFLYAPLIPPVLRAFDSAGDQGLWANFAALPGNDRLLAATRISLLAGGLTALITPLLALAAAEAVKIWGIPRLVIVIVLIPLFIPGISMGVATALFFQLLGITPSLWTIVTVQVLWALPFAFLIILTVMANFDQTQLEAAYLCGANRLQAFFEIELPQIHPGILGAAVFSLILSFNETIRTAVVQGGNDTVQTYLWSQYQQVGLSPDLYALMTVLILVTLGLVGTLALLDRRQRPDTG